MLLREVPEHRREPLFARLVFGIEERLDGFGERILPRGSVVLLVSADRGISLLNDMGELVSEELLPSR